MFRGDNVVMTINLICIGKITQKYYNDAMDEYKKRLSSYCKFNVISLSEAKIQNEESEKEIMSSLSIEADAIKKHIQKGINVALCVEGTLFSSEDIAQTIKSAALDGSSQMNFIIGSSHGMHPDVKRLSDIKLSISKMTLPHQLCRVVLTEQIYRAFKINANERYHK